MNKLWISALLLTSTTSMLFITQPLLAKTAAGKALVAKGAVTAAPPSNAEGTSGNESANSNARKIKRRSLIYSDEVVSTGSKSKAQLRMTDGGMIALKESSELVISEYQFSDENGKGSVTMELLKGGLRSVTGAIKADQGDYNLKTPVGSIGIRGTHYEVELIEGDMFLAVWDGAVDLTVNTGDGADVVSFGEGEDFSFAVVSESGEVTEMLEPPENFNDGHSSDTEEESSDDESSDDESSEEESSGDEDSEGESSDGNSGDNTEEGSDNQDSESETSTESNNENTNSEDQESAEVSIVQTDIEPESTIDPPQQGNNVNDQVVSNLNDVEEDNSFLSNDEFNTVASISTEQLIAERQGSFTYNTIENSQISSSLGGGSNFAMEMVVNFDNGTIPSGVMSFDDNGGEWFATFGGVISTDNIELDVSFASHGDNLADGDINANFFDGLDSIIGSFDLHEIQNPDINVKGSYTIK